MDGESYDDIIAQYKARAAETYVPPTIPFTTLWMDQMEDEAEDGPVQRLPVLESLAVLPSAARALRDVHRVHATIDGGRGKRKR